MESDLTVDHPGLVPGMLLTPEDGGSGRRTARDWTVDVLWFLLAVGLGLVFFTGSQTGAVGGVPDGLVVVDLALGAVCCLALWWRRRYVMPIAGLAVAASLLSAAGTAAAVLILFSTAVHRRTTTALGLAVAISAGSVLSSVIRPQKDSLLITVVITVAVDAAVLAWGMFVRARRQLVLSLRERAERAESEQRLQGEQARLAERTRIAREMHDVLGHRISLIALQAGGLEINAGVPPEQIRETARLVRSTAHRTLEELRDVIGVLRSDLTGDPVAPPQPTLDDVPRLVAEVRRAGANVHLEMDVTDAASASTTLGRDAYRIVQEALTNVAKHARGTATSVQLAGGPGRGLRVCVRNRLPVSAVASPLPGAGAGLLGLQERVTLTGGTLTHTADDGFFVVDARLRWEPV